MDKNTNMQNTDEAQPVTEKNRKTLSLYHIALIVECSAFVSALAAIGLLELMFLSIAFVICAFLFIWTIAAPVIGVILGIISLCTLPRTKQNVIFSSVAIALPVIVVLTLIILFSTRVIVIRFM